MRGIGVFGLCLVAAWLPEAAAQDEFTGLDAHGFWLAPGDGDLQDPVIGYRPEVQVPKSFGFSAVFEFVDAPLVLHEFSFEGETRVPLLDDVFALNVSGQVALHERFAVGLTLPVYLTTSGLDGPAGPTLGDLRLAVPVGILLPGEEGFGLSFVPYADLPTGNASRFVGNSGFSGGGLLAAGYTVGPLALTANVGAGGQSAAEYWNLAGGFYAVGSLDVAVQLGDHHAVGGEVWARPRLERNMVVGSESPGEVLVYGRGLYDSGLHWLLGGGLGVTPGAGSSNFRVFGGVGWTFGKAEESDRDGDGILDEDDTCPDVPEVVNGYADDDGCADTLSSISVLVRDEDGTPLPDATLTLGGEVVQLDGEGRIQLTDQMPGTELAASAEHPLCLTTAAESGLLEEGDNGVVLEMLFKPANVRVVTRANTGEVLDATVRFVGPRKMADATVGGDGEETFPLRPGDWEILVSAPAFGVESRKLSLAPGETSTVVIEVILEPAKVAVEATRVVILEKVYFEYDKDVIMAKSLPLLEEVANTLKVTPALTLVEIGGHTDIRGPADYNQDLSQRRVESVKRYLESQGVAPSRLVAKGYGESSPIDKGSSEGAHANNRRVEFTILEQEGLAPE